MQYTENLNLAKYDANDVTSYLEVSNANLTKIDAGHGTLNARVSANTSAIGDVQGDVNDMVPQVADAGTKANAGLSNTASVYDATQTYAVDDYTLYNNNLYRCEVPIPQAESFDGTKWVRVKTTDEIKTCNNKIRTSENEIIQIKANLIESLYSKLGYKLLEYESPSTTFTGTEQNFVVSDLPAGITNAYILTAHLGSYVLPYIGSATSFFSIDVFNATTKNVKVIHSNDWGNYTGTIKLIIAYK